MLGGATFLIKANVCDTRKLNDFQLKNYLKLIKFYFNSFRILNYEKKQVHFIKFETSEKMFHTKVLYL